MMHELRIAQRGRIVAPDVRNVTVFRKSSDGFDKPHWVGADCLLKTGRAFYSTKTTLQMRAYTRSVEVTDERKVKRNYAMSSV
jgi:hypothetical protein